MTRASDNEFPSVLLDEQASAPTTPASGFWRVYAKSDGLYIVDDAGSETGPFGTGGGGGGSGAWTELDTTTLGSAGLITFSSIASGHKTLVVRGVWQSAESGTTGDNGRIRVGNSTIDTGNNYAWRAGGLLEVATKDSGNNGDTSVQAWGSLPSAGHTDDFGYFEIIFDNYADTTMHKPVQLRAGWKDKGSVYRVIHGSGIWDVTSAIDTIELGSINHASNHLSAGSVATLYGVG